jgi:hypothetical protein
MFEVRAGSRKPIFPSDMIDSIARLRPERIHRNKLYVTSRDTAYSNVPGSFDYSNKRKFFWDTSLN